MKDEKETTVTDANDNDSRRFAYMIAWRDRYIAALQEQLAGREEEERLLCALLHYALAAIDKADVGEEAFEVQIPKEKVAEELDVWECRAEDADGSYCVRFTKKSQASAPHGAGDDADGGEKAKN